MSGKGLQAETRNRGESKGGRLPLPPLALSALAAAVILVLTYTGIKRNQSESFEILRSQGVTLLQTLVESANNAITANSYFWDSFVSKVTPIAGRAFSGADADSVLKIFSNTIDDITLIAAYTFNDRLVLASSALNPDIEFIGQHEEIILEAATELLADSDIFQSLVFLPDSLSGAPSAIFLEIDSTRTRGVCLLLDFPGLWEMENEIGIGRLIQRLGAARSVEYIFFQEPDGIVFSSKPIDSALAIEADPFLSAAFAADTISSRLHMFGETEALELVAPFSSALYPDGLFRLGLSLDSYNAGKDAFTRQMGLLAAILFLVAILTPLYFASRKERRALGRSLARAKSLSDTILDSMYSGVLAIRPDNSIELVNNRLREMFALSDALAEAADWRETELQQLLPQDIFARGNSDEHSSEFEITLNGQKKSFLYSVAPIGARDENAGLALVIYDYTRQKELEEEAARKARLAELGDLAAGVAHEIRNPLNAISLAAQRLDAEYAPQDEGEKSDFSFFTSQIKSETGRLNDIVTRLLGLTRVPKAAAKMSDVGAIIEEWARFMESEFERDQARVTLDVSQSSEARVDPDKLRQTLGNLYRNATEAVTGSSCLDVDIMLKRSNDLLQIVFTDNGPGITPDSAEKLFTPYYTTKESGAGLGLSISYRLINDMQGTLELDKSYSGGARFVISLQTK
ncbi:MAG: hypothetical protein IH914_04145 [candidate division Zixibacteria bacterium]|nr:hypothetical protein [candidate division Zixibacteria bacterium]